MSRNYFYWLRPNNIKKDDEDEDEIFTMDDDEQIPSEKDENDSVQGDDEEGEECDEEGEECDSDEEGEECDSDEEGEECDSDEEERERRIANTEQEILKKIYEKWGDDYYFIEEYNPILNTCCCKRYNKILKKINIENAIEKWKKYKIPDYIKIYSVATISILCGQGENMFYGSLLYLFFRFLEEDFKKNERLRFSPIDYRK
jgi:hypothetical protein